MLIRHRNDNEFTLSKWKWKEEVLSYYPSFVQAWACLKLVSRAKQSLPVISLEIPVRPSVVDKNQTLGNLAQVQPKKARTRKPLPMPKRWLNNKQSNPWKIGHEWKPKSSQQQRSAIIVKKQEEANIERVGSQNRPHWKQLHCWSWRRDE
mgnify:CR=1 FL=1